MLGDEVRRHVTRLKLRVAIGDFIIRPVGNVLLIFSIREPALAVDDAGLKVIEMGLNIPFI